MQHGSDDNETQVPTAAPFCRVQTGKEGRGEEWVEDDVEDDEVLDSTWNQGHASDVCCLEEEVVVAQSHQHSKRGNRVRKWSGRSQDSRPATAHRTQGPSTPKPAPRSSLAWQFFRQCPDDKTRVFCMLCYQSLKRSINILNLSTTCMTRQLSAKHRLQWSKHLQNQEGLVLLLLPLLLQSWPLPPPQE